VLLMSLALAACGRVDAAAPALRLVGETMGTGWSVTLVALPGELRRDRLRRDLQALLDELEARLTTWDAESELRRFSDGASLDWTPVSLETATVVAEAVRVGALTGGAFDVTIAPLVELWGFGGVGTATAPPSVEAIEAARARTGRGSLEVRLDPPALRKARPDLALDLSGIAKGYAVDRVAAWLETLGVQRYLVEIGGELRARGHNARGQPWRVGVADPEGGEPRVRLGLERGAVATSGDYRRFIERDGERFTHVLDPRSGRALERGPASVTVFAGSAMTADALATALMVLGPEDGLEFARREGLSVLFLVRVEGTLRELASPALEQWLAR
jgi:thiamine biosynthesis lipoprotein